MNIVLVFLRHRAIGHRAIGRHGCINFEWQQQAVFATANKQEYGYG